MITLQEITRDNYESVIDLTTNKDGHVTLYEEYVASNAYSILEMFFEDDLNCFAICEDEIEKGFVMFGPYEDDDLNIWIHRLMIDYQFQGEGIGSKVIPMIIKKIKEVYPQETIFLGVDPTNVRAESFYLDNGFIDTKKVLIGEKVLEYIF